MKFVLPENVSHIVIEGIEYTPNSDGVVEARTPGHADQMVLLALPRHDPANGFGARPLSADEKASVLTDENAMLRRALADMQRRMEAMETRPVVTGADGQPLSGSGAPGTEEGRREILPGATDTTRTSTAAPQGQSGDNLDKEPAKLFKVEPLNFDDPNITRDQIRDWLTGEGVAVPGNIARDAAVKIAKDTVTDRTKAEAEAAEARQQASGTATEAKN